MMRDQVYAQAMLMAGQPQGQQQELLRILCEAAFDALAVRLREGMTPEDCREAFVTAAAMQAAASMEGFAEAAEFKAGDLTVKLKENQRTGAQLRHQAEVLMGPFLQDRFLFTGV